MADESTPLLGSDILIDRSPPKQYKRQSKNFHTWAMISLAIIAALALGATGGFIWGSQRANSIDPDTGKSNLYTLLNSLWPLAGQVSANISYSPIIAAVVNEAVDQGKAKLEELESIENETQSISSDSPSYKHQKAIAYSEPANDQAKLGYVENEASKYLRNKGYKTVITYESATGLKWASETNCLRLKEPVPCNATRYRTINGTCNNLNHSQTWGVAMTPFRRALPADYEDGVSAPRGGFVTDLPSARDVSTQVHRPVYRQDANFTVMLAVWGQFIDHDITATASSRGVNGSTIACCTSDEPKHPECFPVLLNENDPYYSEYNLTCMEFVRSAPALRCSFGAREQINQVSGYLDGSMIYGNLDELSNKLRSFEDGQLRMSYTTSGRPLLPISADLNDGCNQLEEVKEGRYCFLSGDTRANENSHLTSMHLIFARQHNNIALQLKNLNPEWDDETLFQEARRIVIAQIQHITYEEFLPIILGSKVVEKLQLTSVTEEYWTGYRADVDAGISNNFATSSFRFAHTLIPRLMKLLANDSNSAEYVETHKMLFNPFGLHKGDLDSIIRGALDTGVEKADAYFNEELTEHLFENDGNEMESETKTKPSYGLDLVALNIQRGRDHGLPSYPRWREYCGFSKVTSFKELDTIFDKESLKIIATIYKSVEEIDLYTGSLSETPIDGGLVGPTLTCLISDQFFRIKHGDRYWYETGEQPQAFTKDQLAEIRKTSLAGIICQNADNLDEVPPFVMRASSKQHTSNNTRIRCSRIPQPDFTKFKAANYTNFNRTAFHSHFNVSQWLYKMAELNEKRHEYPNAEKISHLLSNGSQFDLLNSTAKRIDTKLAKELLKVFTDVFKSSPLGIIGGSSEETNNVTLTLSDGELPLGAIYIWQWNPQTKTLNGTLYEPDGESNSTLTLEYDAITEGHLEEGCLYYSNITTKVNFDLYVPTPGEEAASCTVVAPIVPQPGSITIVLRDPKTNALQKEEELSLEKREIRTKFQNVSGSVVIAVDGNNKLIWNGSYPVEFDTQMYWYADNTTVTYPVSWSGFYIDSTFVGSFLLPEKANNTVVWHEGEFTINLGNNTDIIKACQVYTAILFLSTKEEVSVDLEDLQRQTEWDLNQYVRIILIGTFNEGKFSWNGELILITPKVTPHEEDTAYGYRPYIRYAGQVLGGTLYAELNGPKYLWWTGELPSTVLIPADMPVNITRIFEQALIWTPSQQNGTFGHAIFTTYANNSQIHLSGDFDFQVTSLLNSPALRRNVTYYSPLILQQKAFGFADDILQKLSAKNTYGVFAPVTLLGTYSNHVFAWNGKFIISLVDN